MSPKYRQPGYMDNYRDEPQKQRPKPKPQENTFGPRPLNMPEARTVSRCAECGTIIPVMEVADGKCPRCGFELHSCKQCLHFDPSSRYECRQPVPERVARKDVRNTCTFYAIRTTVERTTSNSAPRADDARKAFENLFKKL